MKLKHLLGVTAFAIASAACGRVDAGQLQLTVNGVQAVDRYEIRIFGAALACTDFMAAPGNYRTVNTCTANNVDLFTTCHVEMAIVTGGPVRMTPISDGTRAVTILGFNGQTLTEAGCADNVQVRSETTSVVTITMHSL
jgi:hypothetical protein